MTLKTLAKPICLIGPLQRLAGITLKPLVIVNGNYTECSVTTIGLEPTPIVSECAPDSFPSVQAHFDIIKSAFEERAFSIYVDYHEELGHPIYIGIDQSLQIADEEFSLNVEITLL